MGTMNGLTENDVKQFSDDIPSIEFDKYLAKHAEDIFDECWNVVKDISYTQIPFPPIYNLLGETGKALVDKIYEISGCEQVDILQHLTKKMNGKRFVNLVAKRKRDKIINLVKQQKHTQVLANNLKKLVYSNYDEVVRNILA